MKRFLLVLFCAIKFLNPTAEAATITNFITISTVSGPGSVNISGGTMTLGPGQ
ncbi:hypothetical protein KGP36_02880 [Patescibacteria group bacterium]|nr:hypothetical protein [Patescibacteria group bacterium]